MTEQLALASLLADADRRADERRDLHRGRVQAWFDSLPEGHKRELGEWMTNHEWDRQGYTLCRSGDGLFPVTDLRPQALSGAHELIKCLMIERIATTIASTINLLFLSTISRANSWSTTRAIP